MLHVHGLRETPVVCALREMDVFVVAFNVGCEVFPGFAVCAACFCYLLLLFALSDPCEGRVFV